ncbi:MAG: CotH kinase family protein [Prevotella sp.]|nr:CotH kinase family protein [Prevotella sp.]MBO5156521.1 CotH kinase family protein [Prevotella sp.]
MKKTFILFTLLIKISFATAQQIPSYDELKIAINESSLPLINITVDIANVTKEQYIPAEIEITDPLKRTDNKVTAAFRCKIKYRGTSSIRYEKKSFAVKLLDDNGKSLDAPILGIREDDSWILNAMAIDRIRMRDRLLFDVWNDLSSTPYNTDYENRNGTKGYFVEVFLNGEYHGLYCMTDKINRKLLGLKKIKEETNGTITTRGLLLKCNAWSTLAGYNDEPMDTEEWNSWELQYPDDYPSADTYMPLARLIDFCTGTSSDVFKAEYQQHFYKQNLMDYHIFYLTFNIFDNLMKNTFLSTVDLTKKERFMITPWDLDCSLGGSWDGVHADYLIENEDISANPFARLWQENTDNYKAELCSLWQKTSNAIFSEEAIAKRMSDYAEAFVKSGAWEREYKKWNNNPVVLTEDPKEELDYINEWFRSRHTTLDNYFNSITGILTLHSNSIGAKKRYNLSGQKVDNNYKGIVIENGRLFIRK